MKKILFSLFMLINVLAYSQISILPGSYSFGSNYAGKTATSSFTIINYGDESLFFNANGTASWITSVVPGAGSIGPNESIHISVSVRYPETKGSYSGSIIVTGAGAATLFLTSLGPEKPVAPTGLKVSSISSSSAKVSWDAAARAEGYYVYFGGTKTSVSGTSYTLTNLSPDTEYSVSVSAYNVNGESATVSKDFWTLLSPPTNPSLHEWTPAMVMIWNAPTGNVDGYIITQLLPVSRTLGTTTLASFAVTPYLKSGTNVFMVQAYNEHGNSIGATTGTSYTPPTAPTNVTMHEWGTAFVATWSASTSAVTTGYTIKQNYPVGRTVGTTTYTSFAVTPYLSEGMNVFTVYAHDKFGLLSTGVSVGCYTTTSKGGADPDDIEGIKEEFGLQEIFNLSINGAAGEVTVFPNPITNVLFITGVKNYNAILMDINGKTVMQFNDLYEGIDVSSLSNGMYFLKVESEGSVTIEKIIKQ